MMKLILTNKNFFIKMKNIIIYKSKQKKILINLNNCIKAIIHFAMQKSILLIKKYKMTNLKSNIKKNKFKIKQIYNVVPKKNVKKL